MRWRNELLVVLVTLAGCATPTAPTPFPVEAAQDCPIPAVDTKTNGGLARGIQDLRASIKLCNNDKATIREWLKGAD